MHTLVRTAPGSGGDRLRPPLRPGGGHVWRSFPVHVKPCAPSEAGVLESHVPGDVVAANSVSPSCSREAVSLLWLGGALAVTVCFLLEGARGLPYPVRPKQPPPPPP